MVEIRFGEQYEATDLAGLTVGEAREQFRAEFGIPDKAAARLNGSKVKGSAELDTVLNDDDQLSFAVAKRNRGAYLVGALLLAMAVTGGVFAAGFINGTATLSGTATSNFADVSPNATGIGSLAWTAYGAYKGSINCGPSTNNGTPIFNIDTKTSGYNGDLAVSVTIGNIDQLAKVYRVMALKLGMNAPDGSAIDINESGAADANDWVMLTMENGAVSMFPKAAASNNVCTVRVKSGFYVTHVKPFAGWAGSASPDLFCEVAQR